MFYLSKPVFFPIFYTIFLTSVSESVTRTTETNLPNTRHDSKTTKQRTNVTFIIS